MITERVEGRHDAISSLYARHQHRVGMCLAGALRGIQGWPPEWVELIEAAVVTDPYTIDKRTARQIAEGLYKACLNELRKVKGQTSELESLLVK